MNNPSDRGQHPVLRACALALLAGLAVQTAAAVPAYGQANAGNPVGEWRYWGADMGGSRYSPLDQINAANFDSLEVAWIWRTDNFGPSIDQRNQNTPIYVNGRLYGIAGNRRNVVSIDPSTGETLWTYREPHTARYQASTRKDWGKGLAYAEIDGRGVIYMTSPAYFLHAIDARTGRPLEGFGGQVPVEDFPPYGVVDMLQYNDRAHPFDPYNGPARELGFITTSSPPIVVNGVIIVGSALADGGTGQTRIENIPGDILAFDAKTGAFLWKFHTIPRAGEFGNDTWENDAWQWTGNAAAWPPFAADPELGIVYIPTEDPTNDYYGGFRPGNNLFANSLVALDIRTGQRKWHFQIVHHDIWDWDLPVTPILADLNVDGRTIPAVIQVTKFARAYTFNRITGEPVWPIIETPVPQSTVPGEKTSPTQPIPTKPPAWERQGISVDDLADFTPEVRAQALQITSQYKLGPLFNPALHVGNPEGLRGSIVCPSFTGGTNATGGIAFDPIENVLYVSSVNQCIGNVLQKPNDDGTSTTRLGKTVADWNRGSPGNVNLPGGIPISKPPYSRITAIDMNRGEIKWWAPNGDLQDNYKNSPLLQGVDVSRFGRVGNHPHPLVTRSLLIYGEGRGGAARLHAIDKATGQEIATVDLPASTSAQPMSFEHNGRQYIVVAVGGGGYAGALVALTLPQPGGGGGGFGGGGGGGGFGGGGGGVGGGGGGAGGGANNNQ